MKNKHPQTMELTLGQEPVTDYKVSVSRRIGDIREIFISPVDEKDACKLAYEVIQFDVENNVNNMLAGVCILYPGKIGNEFYMTKGHRHRNARSEVYIGVTGEGILLMQSEDTGECMHEIITKNKIIYVPEGYAHRHINIGNKPLVTYFSVPADAGHDYEYILDAPFKKTVTSTGDSNIGYDIKEVMLP